MKVGIIGAGIIGLSIADELLRKGEDVTLFDPGLPGGEASGAAAGMLAPQLEAKGAGPFLSLCVRSRELYPEWQARLAQESGLDPHYRRCGALKVAMTSQETLELDALVKWQRQVGLSARMLPQLEARHREPSLNPDIRATAYFPDEAQVDSRRLVEALARVVERRGGRRITEAVEAIEESQGRAEAVRTRSGRHAFDELVLCAGAWSGLLSGATGLNERSVYPVRGQLAAFTVPSLPLTHLVVGSAGYVVPKPGGRFIAGTTSEHVGYHKAVTPEGIGHIRKAATTLCPAFETLQPEETWSGLRPGSSDGAPILGPSPLKKLWLATGHFRNGILLAPLTALLLAKCVRGKGFDYDLQHFRFDRFST